MKKIPVIIVEDSLAVRERLRHYLSSLDGVEIVGEADEADDAIRQILEKGPRIVVLDLFLIRSTGLEVLQSTRAALPRTMFAVVTNVIDPGVREQCLGLGADAVLDKSRDILKLEGIIRGIAEEPEWEEA